MKSFNMLKMTILAALISLGATGISDAQMQQQPDLLTCGFEIGMQVNLDARYTLGVVDIFDVPGDPSAKNGSFAITLGVGF